MDEKEKKLTNKEREFCYNYVCNPETKWNGTKSAIKAGYRVNRATEIAYETRRKPHVKKEIDRLIDENKTNHKELEQRIIEEREKLAFSNVKDFINPETCKLENLTDIDTAAIKKVHVKTTRRFENGEPVEDVDVRFELHEKPKSLDSLANYLGIDKGSQPIDINVNLQIYEKQKLKLDELKQKHSEDNE